MSWLHPYYLWLLVAIPLAALLFWWAARQRRQALRQFGDPDVVARLVEGVNVAARRWKALLLVCAIALLVLSLAGPRLGTTVREAQREGVDLVIALDVSLSMHAEDVAPNRLARAKHEINRLLDQLSGDRVGLVLFAGEAFIQCPLTLDYSAVRLFLDIASPSMIPTPGTHFGQALQTSLRAFDAFGSDDIVQQDARSKVVLIVSDGEHHDESVQAAMAEAQRQGVIIFAAGIGETDGVPIPTAGPGGRRNYHEDRQGNVVITRLDDSALRTIAQRGAYYRISRDGSELPQFIQALGSLDRHVFAMDRFMEYEERYRWPLALALFLLFAERMITERRRSQHSAPYGSL